MLDYKWIALIALVFQNSGMAVVMRYTFVNEGAKRYLTSTAVVNAEIMKFFISIVVSFIVDGKRDVETFKKECREVMVVNSNDWFKLMVPAVLYTLQNSLNTSPCQCCPRRSSKCCIK